MFIKINEFDIENVSISLDNMAIISEQDILVDAINKMQFFGHGICCIVNSNNELEGVLTDGDIRRLMLKFQGPLSSLMVRNAIDFATKKPVCISPHSDFLESLRLLQEKEIWDAPIVEKGKLVGLVHLHHVVGKLISSIE